VRSPPPPSFRVGCVQLFVSLSFGACAVAVAVLCHRFGFGKVYQLLKRVSVLSAFGSLVSVPILTTMGNPDHPVGKRIALAAFGKDGKCRTGQDTATLPLSAGRSPSD
jgi:hypothetical protein